jgi:predicted outer membrane repeat protein
MRNVVNRTISTLAILGMLLAGMPVLEAHAATITVNTTTDPGGLTGLFDHVCSLREAVANANNDNQGYADCAAGSGADTINLSGNIITASLGQLDITSAITLYGGRVMAAATPASATWRLFMISPGASLTLDSVFVMYGRCTGLCPTSTNQGGGIYVNGGSLTMKNDSRVIGSIAGEGGGIYNYGGTLNLSGGMVQTNSAQLSGGGLFSNGGSVTVSGSTFSGNAAATAGGAGDGGGIYCGGCSGTFTNSTFTQGAAVNGGGIYNDGGSLQFTGGSFSSNQAAYGGGMYQAGGNSGLQSVTFSQNSASDYGGGMYNGGGLVQYTGGSFSSNQANYGGGMFNAGISPGVTNVGFSQNSATYGGGVYNSSSSPSMSGITFSNNTASIDGGALYNDNSSPALETVLFSNNTATGNGGGMFSSGGSPSLTNVRFSGNSGVQGGGMLNHGSTASLLKVTFDGNTATYGAGMYNKNGSAAAITNATFSGNSASQGGALFNMSSNPALTNVTISGNSATYGGGLYNFSSSPVLSNAIAWGDSAPSGGPEFFDLFSSPAISYSVIAGGCASVSAAVCGSGNLSTDPKLGALGPNWGFSWSMALGAGSSAIDTGNPGTCPAVDQRGVARPQDGDLDGSAVCDMGGYEARLSKISGNAGTAGAVLSYWDGGAKTATADGNGDYWLPVVWKWGGIVTPSLAGCTFAPTSKGYTDVANDISAQNYTATCLSSTIVISGNVGVADAILTYDNGGAQTATADGSGNYSFTVPGGWDGTVIPASTGYSFTPASRDYSDVATDQTNQDYGAEAWPSEIGRLEPAAGNQVCLSPELRIDLYLTDLLRTNGAFDPTVVTLSLDGADVIDSAEILQSSASPASHASIRYTPGSELTPGAHSAEFTFPTAGGPYTLQWAFLAADMTCAAAPAAAPDSENDAAMRSVSQH